MISSLIATQAFAQLQQNSALNRQCFECGSPSPTWASLPNAIFLCLTCSGIHRSLGVHISFVRSITMDAWSEKQLKMMMNGGNDKLKEFFTNMGIYNEENRDKDVQWKYRTKASSYYREMIRARVEEREIPEMISLEEATLEDSTLVRANPIVSNSQSSNVQVEFKPMRIAEEDPLDKVKNFLVLGYQKTTETAKDLYKKADDKYHEEEFQNKLTQFKADVSVKSSELADKTKVTAAKGVEAVKEGWGFLRQKFNEITNKQSVGEQQLIVQPNSQVEEIKLEKPIDVDLMNDVQQPKQDVDLINQ